MTGGPAVLVLVRSTPLAIPDGRLERGAAAEGEAAGKDQGGRDDRHCYEGLQERLIGDEQHCKP